MPIWPKARESISIAGTVTCAPASDAGYGRSSLNCLSQAHCTNGLANPILALLVLDPIRENAVDFRNPDPVSRACSIHRARGQRKPRPAQQKTPPPCGGGANHIRVKRYVASEPPSPSGQGPLPRAVDRTSILSNTGMLHFIVCPPE